MAVTPSKARWGARKPSANNNDDDDDNNNKTPRGEESNENHPDTINQKPTTPTSAKKVLDTAIGTRKETITATNRILRDLEAAKALEMEALEMLHRDLERVRRVEGTLVEIDSTMARAKMQITVIARKLYRDGCFKICVALLLCAIIVIAVMLAMEGFDKIGQGIGGGGTKVTIINPNTGDAETTTTTVPPPTTTTTP